MTENPRGSFIEDAARRCAECVTRGEMTEAVAIASGTPLCGVHLAYKYGEPNTAMVDALRLNVKELMASYGVGTRR